MVNADQIPTAVNPLLFKPTPSFILKGNCPWWLGPAIAELCGRRRNTSFGPPSSQRSVSWMDEAYQVLDTIMAVETGAMDKTQRRW